MKPGHVTEAETREIILAIVRAEGEDLSREELERRAEESVEYVRLARVEEVMARLVAKGQAVVRRSPTETEAVWKVRRVRA